MAQELNIRLADEKKQPLYRQIYEYIRGEIRSGGLEANERLPSTRALAANLHVARSTAELAYSQLLSEGYIRAKKNSGYYVNEIENLSELHLGEVPPPDARFPENGADSGDMKKSGQTGFPDVRFSGGKTLSVKYGDGVIDFSLRHTEVSVFPYSTWKRIMREVMVDANAEMFSHSEPGGDQSLRATIAHYLHFSRGVRCVPEQVIVGAGNDYLLMLLRHILGEHRTVAMEDPSYLRAAQIFSSFGYRIRPVRMDGNGVLPQSVSQSGADLFYAMPAHQFPVGCVMPVARRAALLGWASEAPDRYIIEDDYDSEFRYRGKPIPSLQSLDQAGRVIYIGTFSKVIAPAIRISYMILPPALFEIYRDRCWFFSSTVSRIDQRILCEFMKGGHFERHLNRMRSLYRNRHDVLMQELKSLQDQFTVRGAGTGLHLILEQKPGDRRSGRTADPAAAERKLARLARDQDVVVYCMSDFRLPAPPLSGAGEGDPENEDPEREDPERERLNEAGQKISQIRTPAEPVRRPSILLGFGALDEAQIREGVRRLSKAWGRERQTEQEL